MIVKMLFYLSVFAFTILTAPLVHAQHNELSFHLTPHQLSATRLEVSSPVVMEKDRFAGLGGVSYARFSKAGFGLRYGFNLGYIRARFDIQPKDYPREIFGPVIIYNSLSIEPVKRLNFGKSQFEVFGGADLRYFHSNGYSSYGNHYQSTDPSEFTDYEIRLRPFKNKFQPNLYSGITYIQALNETNRISISLLQNFGLKKLGDGLVSASADNGGTFQSVFNSVTDFTGIRVQYGNNVSKRTTPVAPNDGLIRKALYWEALGSGGLFSFNYDRRLKPGNDGFGFRVGLGLVPDLGDNSTYLTIPLYFNHILGKGRSGLETAVGLTPWIAVKEVENDPKLKAFPFLNIGYRLQPIEKGFLFRFGWTPNIHDGRFDARGAGLSLGYSFK
ncbi:hypothetical protein [Daejeonella sp.]|uniref:hypothetical protein n=1 Tax=Daejeonella sp. TaxID=2805397 RepID=UPI0030BB0BB5